MKKILVALFIISFTVSNAQYFSGTICDNSGTRRSGLIKIKSNKTIKFKKEEKSNVTTYNYKQISGFEIYKNSKFIEYVYRDKLYRGSHLLEVVKRGKMNLYKAPKIEYSGFFSRFDGNRVNPIVEHKYGADIFFVEKNNMIYEINSGFGKRVDKLFADCPKLIRYIKNESFGKVNRIWRSGKIKEIVSIYNKCPI